MTNLTELYQINNFIDTFALGHYARVFDAHSQHGPVAFKIMRPEHLTENGDAKWEFKAFMNEAELITKMADSPSVINLLDCGYVSTEDDVPKSGEIVSYQLNVAGFVQDMGDYAQKGWRPYLTFPILPRTQSLFYLMKPTQQASRWRLPTEEGLALAVQFAQMLQMAHQQGIVFLDHKLEHVYWDGVRLEVIDWNSSKQLESRASTQYFRTDIHNLCVGILYSVFTGMSPVSSSLRPQPGNLQEVESRYKDVTTLDFGIEPTLSSALKDLLQKGAAQEIESIDDFIYDLQQVCATHGWDFRDHHTSTPSREARDKMRQGLRQLRQGQENIRQARDLFRDAAILDDIPEDLEDELRRLVKATNDMLNKRVIP